MHPERIPSWNPCSSLVKGAEACLALDDQEGADELYRRAVELRRADVDERQLVAAAAQVIEQGEGDSYVIDVRATTAPKCVRCWHRRPDVGSHADHPELCDRCVTNITTAGEERHYA
jgi:isoleucyl-tRNA synthetase